MRIKAHVASMLLATALALSGIMIQFPPVGTRQIDSVPSAVLSSARTCLVAIDQFIVDGDLASLWQTLDHYGHGLDPWPSIAESQRDLVALAFRATFPELRLTLEEIVPSDDVYSAQIGVTGTSAKLPTWLNGWNDPVPALLDTRFGINQYGAVVGKAPLFPNRPLVFAPPDPLTPFMLSGASHLVAAQLTLTSGQYGDRSIAVTGPALIVPEAGTLLVGGDGRIFAPGESLGHWHRLMVGEEATIGPGDLLYLTNGTAILTMTSPDPAHLLNAGVLPEVMPDDTQTEGGRVTHTTLAGTIMAASAPAPVWFGSIDWVRQAADSLDAGNGSLEAVWLVLPARASATLSRGSYILVPLDLAALDATPASPIVATEISNSTDDPQIVLVLRAETK